MSRKSWTSAKRSCVVARGWWKCDGCGQVRRPGTAKHIVTERFEVVACLCVFCWARPTVSKSQLVGDASEDERRVAEAWEEVFGARGLSAADAEEEQNPSCLAQETPSAFRS